MRLTVLYGALFLGSGAILLTVTYLLVRHATTAKQVMFRNGAPADGAPVTGPATFPADPPTGAFASKVLGMQQALDLRQLAVQSAIALTAMAFVSVLLGWFVAGRVLRPLRTITRAAQEISASSLHERLALDGPDDELKELGDTFDALLERLERSFRAQRQFVANASHELRTPLARQRTVIQVALSDPEADADSLRAAHERVLAANRGQERVIDALLVLARSGAGIDRREAFDLAEVAERVVAARRGEAADRGLGVEAAFEPAPGLGEPRLVERLVVNLVDNALRYNVAGGFLAVSTTTCEECAVLTVVNTGPVVEARDVGRLFEPFQRLEARRASMSGGLGLGLSIVQAIVTAHDGVVETVPRDGGGLVIRVRLPRGG
ncbi:MAG: HAMP domain-containing protein [Catenulispora sp.]|nr:HAMP domain-containing protein [Catenulispora sp.]